MVGFEPTAIEKIAFVFKTNAINHSATGPYDFIIVKNQIIIFNILPLKIIRYYNNFI